MDSSRGVEISRFRTRDLVLVILASWLTTSVGCSSQDVSGPPEVGRVPEIRKAADLDGLSLPLDPYQSDSPAQIDRLQQAWATVAVPCMERFDLTWPRPHRISDPDDGSREFRSRYGLIDAKQADRFGYNAPPEEHAEGETRETEPPFTAEADAVMTGRVSEHNGLKVPKGGCTGEAMRALGDEPAAPGPLPLPRRLANEGHKYAKMDKRVRTAATRWSTCMRDAGFRYATPWDANSDPRWSRTKKPSSLEIETATADVACKGKTNFVGIWFAVESAYQHRALTKHHSELKEIREKTSAIDRKARELLGE